MQPVSWYLNRLSLMSPGEILWRIGQRIAEQLPPASPRRASVASTRPITISLPPWPAPQGSDAAAHVAAAERILAGDCDLFGNWVAVGSPLPDWERDPVSEISAPRRRGADIDYRDGALCGSARNVWEINRHHQLVALAQAWKLTGETRYREAALRLIDSWLQHCPCPMGINWTSALEPGMRLINWYLASRLLECWGAAEPVDGWLESIRAHCRYIWRHQSRYSSANNHLIGEMAGLYCAASAWSFGPESARWRAGARRVLEREAQRQVHPDGVSREQTVGYQQFVLQILILAGLVGEQHGEPFPTEYWASVERMLVFLQSVADAAGHLPEFGDRDDGMAFMLAPAAREQRVRELLVLHAAFSSEETPLRSASAAWLLTGFPHPSEWRRRVAARHVRQFPDGGYYILGSNRGGPGEALAVFDAGPLGYLSIAAHGHADCLSFVLSLGGQPVLVDPGTYCYYEDPVWREYFRGTSAHNTLRVDGCDQSVPGGPFMWLRKARAQVETVSLDGPLQMIRARHDGYARLADPVTHARELRFDVHARRLEVLDHLDARDSHRVERFWHFSAGCRVQQRPPGVVCVDAPGVQLTLQCDDAQALQVLRASHAPRGGWLSPGFGRLQPTTTLVFKNRVRRATVLRTTFRWQFNAPEGTPSQQAS